MPTSAPVSSVTDLLAQVAASAATVNGGLVTSSSSVGVISSNNNSNISVLQQQHHQDASATFQQQQPVAGTTAFRSPNVVAPGSQPIPFLQHRATAVTGGANGSVQAPASGSNNAFAAPPMVRAQPVYPFASMTHAAQSVLGQTASSSPSSSSSSSPSPNQAAAAIRVRPAVSTIINHAAGVSIASTATATPPPPLSPALSPSSAFACATPSQLLPSALHPAAVKSAAAPVIDGAPSAALTPMQQPSIGGSRSPHFQQSIASGSTLTVASGGLAAALTTVTPSPQVGPIRPTPPSINVQQTVPVTTAASSPLLVNLLQQQQQQQMARNSLSNNSSSNSPTTTVAATAVGQSINQVPCVGVVSSSASLGVTTTSPVAMDTTPASETMDKVRQQSSSVSSRVAGGRSLSLNSPLSSSPSASPYHHTSSPNSPASAETNLTLAASVTVLNVRTGAPLNATALSSLAPPPPPTLSTAHSAVQNTTASSSAVAESGEILQVRLVFLTNLLSF